MNQKDNSPDKDMLPEYDFGHGVRSKYTERYSRGSNVVVLSPDVAEACPDSASVNKALRTLIDHDNATR